MSQINEPPVEHQKKALPDSLSIQFARSKCPVNNKSGRLVQNQTLKALLKVSLRGLPETEYFFCADQNCPVVYFSTDGKVTFKVEEIREAVYQKEPDNPEVLVCYCFQHSVGSIKAATTDQRQEILADIKAGVKAEQCACDLRNPQGTCCLGNVRKLIGVLNPSKA
jgi:hypothetical protein